MAIEITPRNLGTIDKQMCTSYTIDRLNLLVRWRVQEGCYTEEVNELGNNKFSVLGNGYESHTRLTNPALMIRFVASLLGAKEGLEGALAALEANHDLTTPEGQQNLGVCMNLLDDVFQGAIESYFAEVWVPRQSDPMAGLELE